MKGTKVLIADNSSTCNFLAQEVLNSIDITDITTITKTKDVINQVHKKLFDIIIIEIIDLDAKDVNKMIKKIKQYYDKKRETQPKIIGYINEFKKEFEKTKENIYDASILKPVNKENFKQIIYAVLSSKDKDDDIKKDEDSKARTYEERWTEAIWQRPLP